MPSLCPNCHRVVAEDEVCCAFVRYAWRCTRCFKLSTGFVVPYGNCFLCGGTLETLPDRDLGDAMRFKAIRDAVRFDLVSFRFFRRACERAETAEQRLVLERLSEAALDHLHDLEDKYRAHVDPDLVERKSVSTGPPEPRNKADAGTAGVYRLALAAECRQREHLRRLGSRCGGGLECEICRELAAEESEYITMLETELDLLLSDSARSASLISIAPA